MLEDHGGATRIWEAITAQHQVPAGSAEHTVNAVVAAHHAASR